MDTRSLKEYIDICELVEETRLELDRLQGQERRPTVTIDKVKGSMQDFPYAETSFKVEGAVDPVTTSKTVETQKYLLKARIREMEKQRDRLDKWIGKAPARMQRIIRYKFFDRLSWEQVADRMGRGATGDSVKKEFQRFLKKN